MRLIIAEKPSVANDLAKTLPGSFTQKEGYWEGPDWLISWAVGHLLELVEPEAYDEGLKVWQLSSLPIIPKDLAGGFQRRPRPGQSKQLRLLKKLSHREDVVGLVNACDAAREGELIFREIEDYVACEKPSERLWLQSMTSDSITEAFQDLAPSEKHAGLGAAAYSRAEADWLIGINATRGITKRLKGRRERGVWSAGRVQTPTLALLVHRETSVLAHVPVPFWRVRGAFSVQDSEYSGVYKSARSGKDVEKIWKEEDAQVVLDACKGQRPEIVEEAKQSKRNPPSLYSLTALQKEANTRFGMSARRTLGAAQRLYEMHKVLTYPRTDFSALPEDYRNHVDEVLDMLAGGGGEAAMSEADRAEAISEAASQVKADGLKNQKRHFDDSKVGDHFAIIPTGKIPSTPLAGDDAKVFELVARRFIAAFMGPSTWEKVKRETRFDDPNVESGKRIFYTESDRLVVPGWQLVDRRPKKSEVLGPTGVELGEIAHGDIEEIVMEEDATRPPKRLTEAGLLGAMEKASDIDLDVHDEMEDKEVIADLRGKGLGTPATRADIIEALIAKGYVGRSGKSLRATAKGITLIDFLERIDAEYLAKVQMTAEMEFHLKQVEDGTRSRAEYMEEVTDSVRSLARDLSTFDYGDLYQEEAAVGECPSDGFPVAEGLKGYRCSRIAKGDQFEVALKGKGKEAERKIAEVADEAAAKLGGLADVQEALADAKRVNAAVTLKFSVPADVPDRIATLQEALEGFAEDSLKDIQIKAVDPDACNFTIWKEFRGRYINRQLATKLLGEKDSGPIEGFVSMRGDFYAGKILLNDEKKLEFEAVKGFKSGDDDGAVAPEVVSFEVDASPFVACPMCGKGAMTETATHFECQVDGEKGCKCTIPRSICKREMRRVDLMSYMDPAVKHTDWIEDFISRKGRAFTARLVLQDNGRHTFEFKPRAAKKKATKKKAKKKATKKKTSKKKA
ncbi:MAG: DNA topoisomerase [Planctomycetes bacterium]|nr:DNA topoisomerase [Planctomycetota bacterium]